MPVGWGRRPRHRTVTRLNCRRVPRMAGALGAVAAFAPAPQPGHGSGRHSQPHGPAGSILVSTRVRPPNVPRGASHQGRPGVVRTRQRRPGLANLRRWSAVAWDLRRQERARPVASDCGRMMRGSPNPPRRQLFKSNPVASVAGFLTAFAALQPLGRSSAAAGDRGRSRI